MFRRDSWGMKKEELGEIGRETGDEVKASLTRKGMGGQKKIDDVRLVRLVTADFSASSVPSLSQTAYSGRGLAESLAQVFR